MPSGRFKAFWDLISLSGGEAVSKIAGFLAFAYLARTLEAEAYGAVEVAAALLSFFLLIVDFGYGPIGARQIARHPARVVEYATAISSARVVLTLFSIPAMCGVALLMDQPRETVNLIWIYAFALVAAPWNQRWLLQGLDRMKLVSLGQLIRMTLFALGVVLFVADSEDLLRVGYIELLAGVAMAAYFIVVQRRLGVAVRLTATVSRLLEVSTQSLATGLSQAAWALYQYLPTLMIATLLGGVQTAWFAAAHRIVFSIVSFSMIYHFNLYPVVARRLKESPQAFRDIVYPSYRVAAWAGISMALGVSLYAEALCALIFGEAFRIAGPALAVLIWTLPITLMSGHSRWALIAAYKQRYVFYAQATGLATTVIGGLLLIPTEAALGGAVTMVISTVAVWLTAHHHAGRRIGQMPFIQDIAVPVLLAMAVLYLAYAYTALHWHTNLALLAAYAAIGLALDRRIVADLKTMLKVKAETTGGTQAKAT